MATSVSLRLGSWLAVLVAGTAMAIQPFQIQIVDASNQWPVPMVELETVHHCKFVSDNAGLIAMDLPELMGTETWFHVRGHGYSVPADGFGYRGVRATPQPGHSITIEVNRSLPAQRLGRLTGAGIFGESQKLGLRSDWTEQRILGCDSVQTSPYGGKLFWAWGDTRLANYPLGRFHMISATTDRQPLGSFEPPIALHYDYRTDDDGVPDNVAEMPGDGPTWLFGLVTLKDETGGTRLGATYSKIKPPLAEYEKGLCLWNDDTQQFDRHRVIWRKSEQTPTPPPMPGGHATPWTDQDGQPWVLFGDPFPTLKCRPTLKDWSSPDRWQTLSTPDHVTTADRDETDGATEIPTKITPHRGSIAWNEFKQRWVTIFTQKYGGPSFLGEIWYAESDSPMGPWGNAIKVVTHDHYTFYNPQLHPEFTPAGSPILLFEGTYTSTFSQASDSTPRHDYNQVLYRLDLDQLNR
ncbi:hypothetical protein K227x_38370 [Rubripirellula lacrimiformis]|uniref:DUF4185 domain-containing protein n=1 Tax=Rubripirellula lacrimiformis TaxID=1930273 RepID=A0A517NE77_9BACT|nr:hypothetical protein [Rubripirellula lacrimiformis]QDT05437.1 hypothetical protein K227x_38370 [Rubripirellula lacrimiformis]